LLSKTSIKVQCQIGKQFFFYHETNRETPARAQAEVKRLFPIPFEAKTIKRLHRHLNIIALPKSWNKNKY
jgi:hypothetical protein